MEIHAAAKGRVASSLCASYRTREAQSRRRSLLVLRQVEWESCGRRQRETGSTDIHACIPRYIQT